MEKPKYILDSEVDSVLDKKLRDILYVCFNEQEIFLKQRYYYEMPLHRWVIEECGKIVAHTALHEKLISVNDNLITVGAIAEVCVHPEFRGRKFVNALMEAAHSFLKEKNIEFSILIANHPNVYSPSGYFLINNEIRYYEPETVKWKVKVFPDVMVAELGNSKWPEGLVDFRGPKF